MNIQLETLTPALARTILGNNDGNRNLRPTAVRTLKEAFSRGEYKITHQGIAISTKGNLLDGQHRLTAISQMPDNFKVKMYVARGVPEDASLVMDTGVKRSSSDILRESRRLIEVVNFCAKLVKAGGRSAADKGGDSITAQYAQQFLPLLKGVSNEVSAAAGGIYGRIWGSASVRAAACIAILDDEDKDYVLGQYKALCEGDFNNMTTSSQALYRYMITGAGAKMARIDRTAAFVIALKFFRKENQNLKQVKAGDVDEQLAVPRAILEACLPE